MQKPLFTVDLEDFNHGLHIDKGGHTSIPALWWLQYKLNQYNVKAIFYVLQKFSEEQPGMVGALAQEGHRIQSHGYYHIRGEKSDRQPYQFLGFCGGFWFRLLPLWFIKKQIEKEGQFYCHIHDLDEKHPKLSNPIMNWKRHVGLKTARKKLERLLQEVKFESVTST